MSALRSWPALTVWAGLVVFALDRLTKLWVSRSLYLGQQVWPSLPVHIDYTVNSGAAFSLLPDQDWLFVAVALLVLGLAAWRWQALGREPWWVQLAVGMLLGGTVANALDRVTQGYVIDFIQIPHFPVFNVADSGITLGAALLVLRVVRSGWRRA